MRKATGKVVSLVLALALVVTSFSSTFAFAATKSETGDARDAKDGATVYLANLSNVADSAVALQKAKDNNLDLFNITDYVESAQPWLETYDHIHANDEIEISSVSVSGDNIIRVSKATENDVASDGKYEYFADKGDYVATVRDVKGTGTATVKVLYTAKTTDRGEDEITVRGSASFKVVLLDAMTPVLTSDDWEDGLDNLQKNPEVGPNTQETGSTKLDPQKDKYAYYWADRNDDGNVKQLDTGKPVTFETADIVIPRVCNDKGDPLSTDAQAKESTDFTLIEANNAKEYKDQIANLILADKSQATPEGKYAFNQAVKETFILSASGTNNFMDVDTTNKTVTYGVGKPAVGNTVRLTLSSVKLVREDVKDSDTNKVTEDVLVNVATNRTVDQGTAKVQNKVVGDFTNVDLGDGSQQMIGLNKNEAVLSKSKAYVLVDGTYWDVTGADIVSTAAKGEVSVSGGKVGSISTSTDSVGVSVSNGTIGDIYAKGDVELLGGSVAVVDFTNLGRHDVVVSGATVEGIKNADEVRVEDGKVTGSVDAITVELLPLNEEVEVSVGDVTAEKLTIDGSVGKASAASYFAFENGEDESTTSYTESTLTLLGDKASINKIDVDYRATDIVLDHFQGTVPAVQHGNYTGYSETGATLKSENSDDSYDDTRATVNGAMNIYTIELNSGAVTFAGNVSVNNVYGSEADFIINAGGLRVTDSIATSNTLKIANAADVAVGTVVYSATSDIADPDSFLGYGFTVKTVAGTNTDSFVIDGVSFSGLSMNQSTAEIVVGDSLTLTASAYPNGTALPANTKIKFYIDGDESYISGVNNGDGTATLTAKAYSSDFSVLNKATVTAVVVDEFDIDLEEYGAATCVVTVIPEIKSTYASDTTGNVSVKAGDTYQFKITSLDGKVPTFGIGSPSFKLVAQSSQGNDHFFKVQAVGNIGDACGIYINSDPNKVAVLHVTADYTCDTTTVDVPVGGSYQVKITANARPIVAAGNSIYTVEYVSNSGNDYFFKITATQNAKAGDVVGFYVNGGPRAFVATTV